MPNLREVAVVGVGMTKFGRFEDSSVELFSQAAMDAITESNIGPRDIQALFVGNCYSDCVESQANIAAHCASDLGVPGIPANRYDGACASASVAIREAILLVAAGVYDIVLAGGTEKSASMETAFATRVFQFASDCKYEIFTGLTFPGIFAQMAHLYASKYNIPLKTLKRQMQMVAIKSHNFAKNNEKAQLKVSIRDLMDKRIAKCKQDNKPVPGWKDEFDYLNDLSANIMVADPLQVQDCCPFTDGASAIVIASLDRAKQLTKKPVLVAGMGQASAGAISTQKDLTRPKAREMASAQAYKMAGMTPKDINICELHDCFTIAEIVASESLGFFEPGKGAEAVEKGLTNTGGQVVIGPSGGLKAKGHPIGATGAAQIYEIAHQLREESGLRQVPGAKAGITDTLGGDLATIVNIILKRGW